MEAIVLLGIAVLVGLMANLAGADTREPNRPSRTGIR
jgi:hypothetical protein